MRDLIAELKQLRLHGMATAWSELLDQGGSAGTDSARWLLEPLSSRSSTRLKRCSGSGRSANGAPLRSAPGLRWMSGM